MVEVDQTLTPQALLPATGTLFELSAAKLTTLYRRWSPSDGSPVFTAEGRYTTRGWTDWTAGFHFGSGLLQFDVSEDQAVLREARKGIAQAMPDHLTHTGVHDHGFNTISTYGNLLRLAREGRLADAESAAAVSSLAIRVSGAVQANRWTPLPGGLGYIHSFNGPHSLFIDTMRSLRALAAAHILGQHLLGEQDRRVNLLDRLLIHAETTARYNLYWGEGRDRYDVRGRVVHEAIFNTASGTFRCPSSQQGYSPFTTWTRGLAWALCGYAEQLQILSTLPEEDFGAASIQTLRSRSAVLTRFSAAATATADFYLDHTPSDGVPYWDTGAPGLVHLGNYLARPADPFNRHEPVDSSAAAIAAQGLLRLGAYLTERQDPRATRYVAAGLSIARTLFAPPYLSRDDAHEGLLLHSVYHRPNGWDHVPAGGNVPYGESSMWGDYHARELALLIRRMVSHAELPPIP